MIFLDDIDIVVGNHSDLRMYYLHICQDYTRIMIHEDLIIVRFPGLTPREEFPKSAAYEFLIEHFPSMKVNQIVLFGRVNDHITFGDICDAVKFKLMYGSA